MDDESDRPPALLSGHRGYLLLPLVHPLDGFPLHPDGAENGEASHDECDLKDFDQCGIIRHKNLRHESGWDDTAQLGSARSDDAARVETGDPKSQKIRDEVVGEDVLTNGDEERASEQLDEHDRGGSDGDVIESENGLSGDSGLLEAEASAQTEDDLIPNPYPRGTVDPEACDEAGADGHEDGRGVDEWHIVPKSGCEGASENNSDHLSKDERKVVNAGIGGADILNGLKPERKVVYEHEKGTANTEGEERAEGDAALASDSWGN